MRSVNLKQRIDRSLKKSSGRHPAFVDRPGNTDAPYSRWHGIKIERAGKLYVFEMNVNDHPNSDGVVRLGHVKVADMEKDEWVEMPREFVERSRNDESLMITLRAKVDILEEGRIMAESSRSVGEQDAYPEEPVAYE